MSIADQHGRLRAFLQMPIGAATREGQASSLARVLAGVSTIGEFVR